MDSQLSNKGEIVLNNITWERFKKIKASFDDVPSVGLTYATGILEIKSQVNRAHELIKTNMRLLLEIYMREKGIRFHRSGRVAMELEGDVYGEPDESYAIVSDKAVPDITIDFLNNDGNFNKLNVYKKKQVPEAWFWKINRIRIFQLTGEDYQEAGESLLFPNLNVNILRRYIQYPDHSKAMQRFQMTI